MLLLEIRQSAAYDLEIDDKVDFDRMLVVWLFYDFSTFEVASGVVSDKIFLIKSEM